MPNSLNQVLRVCMEPVTFGIFILNRVIYTLWSVTPEKIQIRILITTNLCKFRNRNKKGYNEIIVEPLITIFEVII